VTALTPVLDTLVAEGFRIASTLIREALAQVGEGAEPENLEATRRT
jgi:predicted nucleic acid-binding protein